MKENFEAIKDIYIFTSVIFGVILVFTAVFPDTSFTDTTRYYFFLANRHRDEYQYTGKSLDIRLEPEGYNNHPAYIFENKLLFLYYGYIVKVRKAFSHKYNLSFDVYPEKFFKKIYKLDGKIISFEIDILHSPAGVYSLWYKLDMSRQNTCEAKFLFRDNHGNISDMTDRAFKEKFLMPVTGRMRFEIVPGEEDIRFYINKRLVSKGSLGYGADAGLFRMVKFPGSQFQIDNMKIKDLITGADAVNENFNKSANLFDIKSLFFPHSKASFVVMFFAIVTLGYAFDLLLALFGSKMAWLEFMIPQALLLLLVSHLSSFSIKPGLYAVLSIACAKAAYAGVCFLKKEIYKT